MNLKPTANQPVRVYSVRRFFGSICAVKWSDRVNYPRAFETLYRRAQDGSWFSGEAHPCGCYSSPLREAHPTIAAALNAFVSQPKA